MPTPIPVDCLGNLLSLVIQFGAIAAQAQQPYSTWDQPRRDRMQELMIEVAGTCALTNRCLSQGEELLDELSLIRERGEKADTGRAESQLDSFASSVSGFVGCLFRQHEVTGQVMADTRFRPEDFPTQDWLGNWRPNRVKVR